MNSPYQSAPELQAMLGERLRQLRLTRGLDQRTVSEKAGVSERALRNLEAGRGSSLETFLRTLKALDSLDGIDKLVPAPTIDPIALLRSRKLPQRASRPRSPRARSPRNPTSSNQTSSAQISSAQISSEAQP